MKLPAPRNIFSGRARGWSGELLQLKHSTTGISKPCWMYISFVVLYIKRRIHTLCFRYIIMKIFTNTARLQLHMLCLRQKDKSHNAKFNVFKLLRIWRQCNGLIGGGGVEQPGAIYNGSGSLKQATDPFPLQHLAQNTTEPTSWATSKAEAK